MNIILYVMDALRADYLSCYGAEQRTSPVLEDLCEEAVRFENAIAPAPWTKPSAVGLLTGLYPRSLGVMHEDSVFTAFEGTLSRVLSNAGFKTVAASANAFVSPHFGFESFDTFHTLLQDEELLEKRRRAKEEEGKTSERLDLLGVDKSIVPLSEDINDRLVPVLTENKDEDIFALAWSVDTHGPYFVRGNDSYFGNDTNRFIYERDVDRSNIDEVRSLYRDMIRYNDQQLGQLIDSLKENDAFEETLLIVVGDHGEALGDRDLVPGKPLYGHRGIPYEEKIRVPAIVKFPDGEHAGTVVEEPVSLVDVAPTIFDCVGIEPSIETQGTSLSSPESLARDRTVFVESQYKADGFYSAAVRTENHKYLTIDYRKGSYRSLSGIKRILKTNLKKLFHGTDRLYRLDSDPGETEDVSAEFPEMKESLETALINYREEADANARRLVTGPATAEVDEEIRDQLRVLGYFEE